jgi:hypothetical protein
MMYEVFEWKSAINSADDRNNCNPYETADGYEEERAVYN